MKKRILALLLCVQMMLSNLSPLAPSITARAEQMQQNETQSDSGSNVTVESIFPESQLTWKSMRDYLLDQARNAWNYPEMYVGYEVIFMPCWQSIWCRSGVLGNEQTVYASLTDDPTATGNVVDPNGIKLVIEDFYYEESTKYLWYKVKAAEGYALPPVLEQNPYIMHLDCDSLANGGFDTTLPTFIIGPMKAIFKNSSGTVNIKKQPVFATKETAVNISAFPVVFDVLPAFEEDNWGVKHIAWDHADLDDLAADYTEFTFVNDQDVILIPMEASVAYEQLMNAEDTYEYYEVLGKLPDSVLAQLSDKHKSQLDVCIESLAALEQVKYETVVDFAGKDLPVSVVGKLPDDVSLQVGMVSADTVMAEGFDVQSAEDIIVALDIKLVHENGTEWQPKEGRRVAVTIGVGALGYEDGTILRLQHKHGEVIDDFEIVGVIDGAIQVRTSGFSIYNVTNSNIDVNNKPTDKPNLKNVANVANNGTIEMEVGKTEIFFFAENKLNNDGTPSDNYTIGTWNVTDPSGAIHYTVHSNDDIGNTGMYAPYIKISALKEALCTEKTNTVTLEFQFGTKNNNNTTTRKFTLKIVPPKADKGKYDLYLKDDVNASGRIIATLVDENGKEVEGGLDGAAFEWSRDDNYYINPRAYDNDYRAVNIAVDHAGLVEARMKDDNSGYQPTTYTCNVILANGKTVTAKYTVYYQSEFINSNFEFPTATQNYTFFPNGWPELYWKTTAPGQGQHVSKDIEYGFPQSSGTGWGVEQAAGGKQFAELNAEAYGALYQDIISVPGEDISWHFAHAPRQNQNWGNNTRFSNAMFIVIGATETAQELDHNDLKALGALAKTTAKNSTPAIREAFESGKEAVVVTYTKDDTVGEYYVWYHDAGEVPRGNTNAYDGADKGWTKLEGSYIVPEGQYRTRLFFVTDQLDYSNSPNAGNIIDVAKAGQYKTYLIEYYLGVVNSQQQVVVEYHQDYDEKGEALIYSSELLKNLPKLMNEKHQYLYKVLINGENCPYNIRYAGDASLFIENYPRKEGFQEPANHKNDYDDYDIVMQVYLRDVVVAVQKQIQFPAALTIEQKLSIIENLKNTEGGYKAEFQTTVVDGGAYTFDVPGSALITERDPAGNYTGYYSMQERPEINHTYRMEEIATTEIPGLKLVKKQFTTVLYTAGQAGDSVNSTDYTEFRMEGLTNFADIVVVNVYEEKKTTIHYQAVGKGKLSFAGNDIFVDKPTETINYYSDPAQGAKPLYDKSDATFVGWFKDPECKIPVTAADGVWDKTTNSFKPNANIIQADEITFYAKFETGSIVINRSNANPWQTFVYHIKSNDNTLDMYVTLQCDENGNGSVTVWEVPLGQLYIVTECEDWSWRHAGQEISQTNSNTVRKLVYDFTNEKSYRKWLNGCSPPAENVFKDSG